MDSAISKGLKAEEDFWVVRGSTLRSMSAVDTGQDLSSSTISSMVGKVIQDKGFVSTSVGVTPAFDHLDVWYHIRVPAGYEALFVTAKSSSKDSLSNFKKEREVVLPRNTKFMVHKVEDKSHGSYSKKTHVYLEIVPNGWVPPEPSSATKSSKEFAGVTTEAINE